MEKIWANRILAGTKKFSDVPGSRKNAVKAELQRRLDEGIITQEQYNTALGISETPENSEEYGGESADI